MRENQLILNKLASLEATLVQNYDLATHRSKVKSYQLLAWLNIQNVKRKPQDSPPAPPLLLWLAATQRASGRSVQERLEIFKIGHFLK